MGIYILYISKSTFDHSTISLILTTISICETISGTLLGQKVDLMSNKNALTTSYAYKSHIFLHLHLILVLL